MNSFSAVLKELRLAGKKGTVIALIAMAMSLFFLYTSFAGSFTTFVQRGLLLVFAMPLIFLTVANKKEGAYSRLTTPILAVISPIPFLYIAMIQDQLMLRGGIPNTLDIVMGVSATLLVLEATRKKIGWSLPMISIILIIYGFFGPRMPAIIQHRGLDFGAMISALYLGEEGIFGVPVSVTADFIIIFILFGSFLEVCGAGDFFIDLAKSGFGWMRGGPAKAAVISSALMGTVSGSAVANVVTTGTFTIPLMKKTGYRPEIAGAIEAVGGPRGAVIGAVLVGGGGRLGGMF
jgi:TRAP transporter 4TM/12TM fusion protein